jgi:tRNA A-37 threonylcarbamoyl transferase component Bud32/tetratricopeptide (TPR) repeat protein
MAEPSFSPRQIGAYQVHRLLGEGGMGVVLVGARPGEEEVAIKLLRPESGQDAAQQARFAREAEVLRRLTHPGIVRLLEIGALPEHGRYLVMELLPGPSLRVYLRERGGLPPQEATAVARQISAALESAHAMGVVHRDLKPENILLLGRPRDETPPRVKVADFGLAKAPPWLSGSQTELATSSAAFLGTALYMAPEQFRSAAAVTAAADVYALGLILHEMLLGRLPFPATEPWAALEWHQHGARIVAPGQPLWLRTLLQQMLEREPGLRPTMAEVSARLSDPSRRRGLREVSAVLRSGARQARRPLLGLLLIGALGIGGVVGQGWQRRAAAHRSARTLQDLRRLVKGMEQAPGTVSVRRGMLDVALRQAEDVPLTEEVASELVHIHHRCSSLEMAYGTTRAARHHHDLGARLLPRARSADRLSSHYWEGGLALQEGRLERAAHAYRDALSQLGLAPSADAGLRACSTAQEGLGQVLLHQAQWSGAEAAFWAAEQCEQRRTAGDPALRIHLTSYHRHRLGEVAEQQGRWEEARDHYQRALAGGGEGAAGAEVRWRAHRGLSHVRLGRALLRLGDLRAAIAAIEEGARLLREAGKLERSLDIVLWEAEGEEGVAALAEAQGRQAQAHWDRALLSRRGLLAQDPDNGIAAHAHLMALVERWGRAGGEDRAAARALREEAAALLAAMDARGLWQGDVHIAAARRLLSP